MCHDLPSLCSFLFPMPLMGALGCSGCLSTCPAEPFAWPRHHAENTSHTCPYLGSWAKVQQLPSCLSTHSGHGYPVSLRYRWLQCPVQPLQTQASQGTTACAPGWHFETGCCLPGVGLLLFTSFSSSNCRRGRAKYVNTYHRTSLCWLWPSLPLPLSSQGHKDTPHQRGDRIGISCLRSSVSCGGHSSPHVGHADAVLTHSRKL